MKNEFIRIIKIAAVYAGIIFGAGFASGQELMAFFVNRGRAGVLGIIIAGAVLALAGWAVLDIVARKKIGSYAEFMEVVFGRRLGAALEMAVGAFMFVIFAAMLAGFGALGYQAFALPFSAGVLILAALTFAVLLFDIRGVIKINLIVTPFLILGAIILGALTLSGRAVPAFAMADIAGVFQLSSFLYAAYNILTAVAVLATLGTIANTPKIAKYGGLLGGGIIGAIGLLFVLALSLNAAELADIEIPMLALAARQGAIPKYAYILLLIAAIFTTAAANAFAAARWLATRTNIGSIRARVAVCVLGALAAHLGFSLIVGRVYGIFGYLGLVKMIVIFVFFLWKKNKAV